MNTKEELLAYGYNEATVRNMLSCYTDRIGTIHGDYKITDIRYIGNGNKEADYECVGCGDKFTRIIGKKNRYDSVRTECLICKEERLRLKREKEKELREKPFTDEIGKMYGELKVVGHINDSRYICECPKCKTKRNVRKLKPTFVCRNCYVPTIKYDESYIGRKNNRLTIIGIGRKNHKKHFICKCDCGNTTLVKPIFWENGTVVSCGCYQENRSINADETQRIKGIYRGMISRCYNEKTESYKLYGKRGIKICDEWLADVNNFIEWSFANGYNNKLTIDRINPNGNYEPGNCRWTTYKVQNVNRRPREKNVKTD